MPENIVEEEGQKLTRLFKSQPWYVWAGVLGASGIVGFVLWRQHASLPVAPQTSPDTAAPTVDPTANPLGYTYQNGPMSNIPFEEVGVNGNQVPFLPSGVTPVYDANGNLIGYQQPSPVTSPTPAPSPMPTPAPPDVTGGNKNTMNVVVSGALATTPGGIHNHGTDIATLMPGETLTNVGPPTSWGNDTYYPVTFGSLSGWIRGATIGKGGGGYHLPVNAVRNTVDQLTFANGLHTGGESYE